ncbi:hypothetical protein [Micromonospora sp. DT229]|uniref:hypothetical protein n=1 Tax=Micromonospora sp. DT229 TaxID=3393430 RepID=UPI003CE8E27E
MSRQVITKVPVKTGQSVRSGQVVAEVSGRPVIVLSGRFPAYRDIGDGDEGPDVRQMQEALRVRYGTPVTGRLDSRTVADLRGLYRSIGYPAPLVDQAETGEEPSPEPSSSADERKHLRIPTGEFFFVPDLPAAVGSTPGRVGGDGSGPLVTLAGGKWQLRVRLDPTTERLIESMPKGGKFRLGDAEGPVVRLLEIRTVGTGSERAGSADRTAESSATSEPTEATDSGDREAVFELTGKPAGAALGQQWEIFMERSRSSADAVVVPASALWTGADESVSVEIAEAGGSVRLVEVEVLLSVGGRVAVRPRTGELPVGARVVVAERDAEAPR